MGVKINPFIKWQLKKEKYNMSDVFENKILLNLNVSHLSTMNHYGEECFECGSKEELHSHHVVPRSLGGCKTIKLCNKCHGIIHGLDFTNHSILVKKGVQKARENGVILGRSKGSTTPKADLIKKHQNIVECLNRGLSVRKSAKACGVGFSTVQRIKGILKNED